MARVLVAEDSRTQAQQIQLILEDGPHEVELASDGQSALEAMRRRPPDIVLTDLEMPRLNGLELVDAVRREFPSVPVVLMTAHGSEEIAALALSRGAASYIPKAYLTHDLAATVERIAALTGRQHAAALSRLDRFELHFTLDNNPAAIGPILGYLNDIFEQVQLWDATERMRVGVALQEACLNAIYHGNLEIGSEHRQDDESIYHGLAGRRRAEPPYCDRRVHVSAIITPTEAICTVRDEGPGFDPASLPAADAPHNLEKIGGRGLLLMRTFMDKIDHNERGNAVTLRKRRRDADQ